MQGFYGTPASPSICSISIRLTIFRATFLTIVMYIHICMYILYISHLFEQICFGFVGFPENSVFVAVFMVEMTQMSVTINRFLCEFSYITCNALR